MTDEQFFKQHPDRQCRIRTPQRIPHRDAQRAVRYLAEEELAFRSLGPHDERRRRLILYRVPPNNPLCDPAEPQILKVPFLAFADEEIADRDDILLPILNDIMLRAAVRG